MLYGLNAAMTPVDNELRNELVAPSLNLWHALLANVHVDGMKTMEKRSVAEGIKADLKQNLHIFEFCVYSKSCRAPIAKQEGGRSSPLLELDHPNAHGPLRIPSLLQTKMEV